MGQGEVLKFLDDEYIKDNTKWWSIDEIKDNVNKQHGFTGNVWRHVNQLCASEQVETRLVRVDNCPWGYKRVLRAKQ